MTRRRLSKKSALVFILKSMVPYSKENIMLAYKPGMFFSELAKTSQYREPALRQAYWRAKKDGLITEKNGSAHLTDKGLKKVRPFIARRLGRNASLMVIFDIPEQESPKRHHFRNLLKSLEFKQVQKSVWSSNMDHRDTIIEAVAELRIGACVEIYESLRLFPAIN